MDAGAAGDFYAAFMPRLGTFTPFLSADP